MSTATRVGGFLAAVATVFALAIGLGRIVGPVGAAAAPAATHDVHAATSGEAPARTDLPGGLMTAQDGYRLVVDHAHLEPGASVPFAFTVEGPDGKPVTAYTPQHEKELHLIAVRRDGADFQHLHPTRDTDGTWSTDLALTPGSWRVFADLAPRGGEPLTLGTDLDVAGDYEPVTLPHDDVRTSTVDGYTVTLDGDVTPGADSTLRLSVTRGGTPVTDLDPYLGAYGHLVALRAGDLAYLHVHPEGEPDDGTTKPGPDITFGTSVPSAGTYRLFLDFQHAGVVRTAQFVVTATGPASDSTTGGSSGDHH